MNYIDKLEKLCITLMLLVLIFIMLTGIFIWKLSEFKKENKRLQDDAWNFYYELDDLKQNKERKINEKMDIDCIKDY